MDRKGRLKAAYDHLRNCGMVHTQKGFAASLGKAEGTMSKAFKGDEKSLTDNLFVQIVSAYPNMFHLDWFLTGNGEMLEKQITAEPAKEQNQHNNIIETLAGVVTDVERELADIRIMRSELIQARDEFRTATQELRALISQLTTATTVDLHMAADENPRPK